MGLTRFAILLLCGLTVGCKQVQSLLSPAPQVSAAPGSVPAAPGQAVPQTCSAIAGDADVAACRAAAQAGDGRAALLLGREYFRAEGEGRVKPDAKEGLALLMRAADLGEIEAMRELHERYENGRGLPVHPAHAETYLARAALKGADWALIAMGRRLENREPARAMAYYLEAARNEICAGQIRLADAYRDGDMVGRNATQAYFWALRAEAEKEARACDAGERKAQLASVLPEKYAKLAERASEDWKKGAVEKLLPAVGSAEAVRAGIRADDGARRTAKARIPPWKALPAAARPQRLAQAKQATELYETVVKSIWKVRASRQVRGGNEVHQGSAVAVGPDRLLTNCHVIEGQPTLHLYQGNEKLEAEAAGGDIDGDRCILKVAGGKLLPVKGFKPFAEMKIGEEVYSVGAPSGFDQTLGAGIVSGLRTHEGRRYVQTTAQISPGSSGGGLFDRFGNLVGITTFQIRGADGLNFAIAAEDFFE